MTSEIGTLAAQSCVRRWQLGDVTFTYVVDGSMWLAAELFLSAIPSSHWESHPDEIGPDGMVAMSAGGLLIETMGMRILVDAGLGDVESAGPLGRNDCGEFLYTLAALGVDPAAVDVFALTHLHVDHTGWAFRQDDDGSRHPTFPCAQYVLGTAEWAPYTRGERPRGSCGHETVIEPLRRLADLKLIADGDEIAPGVTALVTPGHSSGHTSYVVTTSSGARLIAFGDAFHVPAQLSHPDWGSAPDAAPALVPAARARLLDELCAPDTYAFAIHFGDQPFGQVRRDRSGVARWHPVATDPLLAPPRRKPEHRKSIRQENR